MGIGTHSGDNDTQTDIEMFNGIIDSGTLVNLIILISKVLSGAVNNIDTNITFRFMKSERVIGCALQYLINQKNISRNELFISSKGGFLHEDMDNQIHMSQVLENIMNDPNSKYIYVLSNIKGRNMKVSMDH